MAWLGRANFMVAGGYRDYRCLMPNDPENEDFKAEVWKADGEWMMHIHLDHAMRERLVHEGIIELRAAPGIYSSFTVLDPLERNTFDLAKVQVSLPTQP